MHTGRANHTATLLPNGKVLAVGGWSSIASTNRPVLSSAELYDPRTGTWTPTNPLVTARSNHSAVLLPNGKVLVAGGNNNVSLNSSELYDPATGTWTPAASMLGERSDFTLTLLLDGRVLAAGGAEGPAEVYDCNTDLWSPVGEMFAPRGLATATLLPTGQVLIAGGDLADNTSGRLAEIFDPVTNQFTVIAEMVSPHTGHAAFALQDGSVLVCGNQDPTDPASRNCEVWNAQTNAWKPAGAMNYIRLYFTGVTLSDGRSLMIGGLDLTVGGGPQPSTQFVNSASATFTDGPPLLQGRFYHTATLLADGRVLVAGGLVDTAGIPETELLDPGILEWGPADAPDGSAQQGVLVPLLDGRVLSVGGMFTEAIAASSQFYDLSSGKWSTVVQSQGLNFKPVATLLPTGSVLVSGSEHLALYTPESPGAAFGPAGQFRYFHTSTLLADGRVLICGGNGADDSAMSTATLYDPSNGSVTAAAAMHTARSRHTATLLPDGKVLVAGGWDGELSKARLASVELYDPHANAWTIASAMVSARVDHTASRLPDGRVIVIGGDDSQGQRAATPEIYDSAAGHWSNAAVMPLPVKGHSATVLHDGRIAVAGGLSGNQQPSAQLQVYVPATGSWTTGLPFGNPRAYHEATILPDGRVMILGGYADEAFTQIINTCEILYVRIPDVPPTAPQITGLYVSGTVVSLEGLLFRGPWEASSGKPTVASGTNFPLVQFHTIDRSEFILPSDFTGWTDATFTSATLSAPISGPGWITVTVNGVESNPVGVALPVGGH